MINGSRGKAVTGFLIALVIGMVVFRATLLAIGAFTAANSLDETIKTFSVLIIGALAFNPISNRPGGGSNGSDSSS